MKLETWEKDILNNASRLWKNFEKLHICAQSILLCIRNSNGNFRSTPNKELRNTTLKSTIPTAVGVGTAVTLKKKKRKEKNASPASP